MAKKKKKKEPKKRESKYDTTLKIKGSFDQVLNISAQPPKKKKEK